MRRFSLYSPPHNVDCETCGEFSPGVIIRKVGDVRDKLSICGRCLALAMQDITKQNWLSQWTLWQANSLLGRQIQEEKQRAKALRQKRN